MMQTAEPSDTQQFAGVLTPDSDLRQSLLGSGVMRHPAKQHLPQLMHIAQRLAALGITPGSNILDCFGGAGSAMLLCAPSNGGHNVVTIELASHFRAIQAAAWEHFSCTIDMADVYDIAPGMFLSLAGDSRMIPQVLREAGMHAGEQVDAIVTSPSYGGSEAVDKRKTQNTTIAAHGGGNVAKMRYDKAELAKNGEYRATRAISEETKRKSPNCSNEQGYKNIRQHHGGKLRRDAYIDAVVTSPPYQDALNSNTDQRKRRQLLSTENGHLAFIGRVGPNSQVSQINAYSPDASNIGNERGNKYIASMALVWQGAAEVLRPGGILVCITRDCVKNGKRVPVGDQNKALIEAAGLVHLERLTWKIDRLSFWRILQARKNPEAPIISEENVDFFQQPVEVA